jgi:hypothetical protein
MDTRCYKSCWFVSQRQELRYAEAPSWLNCLFLEGSDGSLGLCLPFLVRIGRDSILNAQSLGNRSILLTPRLRTVGGQPVNSKGATTG